MLKYNTPCDTVTLKLQNKDNILNQFAGGWGKLSKVNRAIKWEKQYNRPAPPLPWVFSI